MKIIASILIAMVFTLLGLLKFEGYLNFGTINVIGYDNTFDANLGFIKTSANYIFHIPELIYKSEKIKIKELFSPHLSLDDKGIYLIIVFLFFLVFSGILIYILKYFPKRDDRIYLILGTIISYLLIVELMI